MDTGVVVVEGSDDCDSSVVVGDSGLDGSGYD